MSTDERERLSRRSGRAARIYAVLLLLYPASYRRMFGEQMLQAFRDHFRDAVETEGEAEARFWAHMVGMRARALYASTPKRSQRGRGP